MNAFTFFWRFNDCWISFEALVLEKNHRAVWFDPNRFDRILTIRNFLISIEVAARFVIDLLVVLSLAVSWIKYLNLSLVIYWVNFEIVRLLFPWLIIIHTFDNVSWTKVMCLTNSIIYSSFSELTTFDKIKILFTSVEISLKCATSCTKIFKGNDSVIFSCWDSTAVRV